MESPLPMIKEEEDSDAGVCVDTSDAMDTDLKQENKELRPVALPSPQGNTSSASSNIQYMDLSEDELFNAVHGHKRGVKVGTGRGTKRKAEHEYSQNEHTQKARRRKMNMTAAELDLEAAKSRERTALSRKMKTIKNKKSYLSLSPAEQEIFDRQLKASIKAIQAIAPDSSSTISRHMFNALEFKMDERMEKLKFEDKFVKELSHLGLDADHEVFWHDDDDDTLPSAPTKKTSKKDISRAEFGERLDLALSSQEPKDELDRLATLPNLEGVDAATLATIYDTVRQKCLGLAEKRANHVMFVAYQDDLVDRADIYAVGLERLHRLCVDGIPKDPDSKATDVFVTPRIRAFVVALAHVSSVLPQKLLQGDFKDGEGIVQPDGIVRKPLPCELNETGWYDLPGPAALWPDDKSWYKQEGLEVDPEHTEGTVKAMDMVESGVWVEGWASAMIRGDAKKPDYSIRWEAI